MGRSVLVLALAIVLAAGCVTAAPTATPTTPLSFGLGFIPSVQFAQFYRAQQQGYYRAARLDVTFRHGIDPELITLIGQGTVDIGMADGTSVIPAVSQGIPVRYAAAVYARFPSVVVTLAGSGIERPADLRGRKLGIPGRFGSSWIMLQALLASAGLTPDDLEIVEFPDFGQAVALRERQVDAATGFANNEPVQLALAGLDTNVLRVDEITPLPGPGLTVGEPSLSAKREALGRFVEATQRAMREIIDNPQAGLEDAIAEAPELGEDRPTQLAILQATIEMWNSSYTEQHGLGAIDRQAWSESIEFMRTLPESVVSAELTVEQLVTEDLLP